jgi:uncharacterized protein YjbI with pentapeptide repeats
VVRLNRTRRLSNKEVGGTELDLVPVIDFLLRPAVPAIIGIALIVVGACLLAAAPDASSKSGFLGASLLSAAIVALAVTWLEWSREEAAAAKTEAQRKLQDKRDRQFRLSLRPDFRGWAPPPGEDYSDIKLPYRDFSGARLRKVVFNHADLRKCIFARSDLTSSNMQSAELFEADFRGAWLGGAHLERAELGRANFDGADLCQTHLDNARIQSASFKRTVLNGAVFTGVDITGIDFSESKGLEEADLTGATVWIYNEGETVDTKVKFPPGFNWQDIKLDVVDVPAVSG